MARNGTIVALALSIVASSSNAIAAPGDDADVSARYAFIDGELARGESYARTWWTVWVVGYGAAAVGSAGFGAITTSYDLRVDAFADAAKSFLGFGSVALTLRTPWRAPGELAAMDGSTEDARRIRLARAEELLEKSAKDEALATSWVGHFAGLAVNFGGAAILWFGYGQRGLAILDLATSVVISEVQVFTTPTDAITSLRRYQAGDFTPRPERNVTWSIVPSVGGAGLRLSF